MKFYTVRSMCLLLLVIVYIHAINKTKSEDLSLAQIWAELEDFEPLNSLNPNFRPTPFPEDPWNIDPPLNFDFDRDDILMKVDNYQVPKNLTKLSQQEMEQKFLKLGRNHTWKDLHDFKLPEYSSQWIKFCLFAWNEPPKENKKQYCLPTIHTLPATITKIHFKEFIRKPYRIETLRCACYNYTKNRYLPSVKRLFYLHPHNDLEYFVLEKENKTSNILFITGIIPGLSFSQFLKILDITGL